VQHAPGIFTYEDALSAGECAALVTLTEGLGYQVAPITTPAGFVMRPDIRNNTRVILDDAARSAALWSRLSSLVPAVVDGCRPVGLNERFRFYRYDPGERFALHADGPYCRPNGEESLLTFMIYLNDGFAGGETTFPQSHVRIVPKTGMLLLFPHELLHAGEAVTHGRKYVLRSDVMYAA
jgi:prolyl 4-hydroxylase